MAASGLAYARDALQPPDLTHYLRWGPFRVRPSLRLSNVGHDDNIFATNANKVGDYTATVSPQLDGLLLLGSRAFFQFHEQLDYTAYLKQSNQSFLNQRGSGRLTVPFHRLGLFTDVALNRYRDRPADQFDIRPKVHEDLLGAGAILSLGWRTQLELSQAGSIWRYSDPDAVPGAPPVAQLDRREVRNRLLARHDLSDRAGLTLELNGTRVDFEQPLPAGDRDSRLLRVLGGFEFGEGGTLAGAARLGYVRSHSPNPALAELSETIGDMELVYRLSSGTRVKLTGERLPGFTVFGDQSYFMHTNYGLRGLHYLNRIFGVESGVASGRLSFPGTAREDRTRSYDAGVRLRLAENTLGRRVEYGLKLGRHNRDSTVDGLDLEQTTVSIDATLGF